MNCPMCQSKNPVGFRFCGACGHQLGKEGNERIHFEMENDPGASCGKSSLPCQGHLKKYLQCSTARIIPPQQKIFSQGESHHTVCLICNGLVKLTRTESDGKQVIVGLRREGWLLGISAFLMGVQYASTAETLTRSKLCFIPIERLKQVMDTDAPFSRWVSSVLSRKVYSGVLNVTERTCLSGKQRLEKFLRELVQAQEGVNPKGPTKIPMVLKNWEMAQLLSVTPQYICRLMRRLEGEGIIRRKDGWLIIPQPRKVFHPR